MTKTELIKEVAKVLESQKEPALERLKYPNARPEPEETPEPVKKSKLKPKTSPNSCRASL